jgi:hypothetical protein
VNEQERSTQRRYRQQIAYAKARAKEQLDKGRLSQSAYDKIVAKADAKLGKSGKKDGDKGDWS